MLGLGTFQIPSPQKESYLVFYADSIFQGAERWLGYLFALLLAGSLVFSLVGWVRNAGHANGTSGDGRLKKGKPALTAGYGRALDTLKLVIPILLFLILFPYVVGSINSINRYRLIDNQLAALDYLLTGTYPFLSLGSMKLPPWFVKAIIFSFVNLPFFLVLLAFLSYRKNKLVFSKYAVAFFGSIMLMIPIWLTVPVMSPQDRFIDNVYNLKTPESVERGVESFHPQPGLKSFLPRMRKSKAGLSVMPTTTFPSSHAAWATIACIYMFETSVAAGLVLAPFLLLSTLGTFFLAQHYFVDAPAGILVGLVAVILSSLIFRNSRKDERGSSFPG